MVRVGVGPMYVCRRGNDTTSASIGMTLTEVENTCDYDGDRGKMGDGVMETGYYSQKGHTA